MKNLGLGIIVGTLALSFLSCKKGGVFCYTPNGNIVTVERVHSDFNRVSLETFTDVYIEQAPDYSVKIEGSENLMDIIETKVSGSELIIEVKNSKCIKNGDDTKVFITMPELRELSLDGSGNIDISNELVSDKLIASINGSGNIEIDSLKTNQLNLTISGSGSFFAASTDTTALQDIKINGSGSSKTLSMPSLKSDVDLSGSGSCHLHTIEELNVKISGSGNVRYEGTPTIDQVTTGSGTVNPF